MKIHYHSYPSRNILNQNSYFYLLILINNNSNILYVYIINQINIAKTEIIITMSFISL